MLLLGSVHHLIIIRRIMPMKTIKQGMRDEAVKVMQTELSRLGIISRLMVLSVLALWRQ